MIRDTQKYISGLGLVFILFAIMMITLPVYAEMPVGTVIGEVVSTDIVATIDHQPIPSFNYNGYTIVIAEDLRSYGFDVRWKPAERRLEVTRSPSIEVIGNKNSKENMIESGVKLHQVLHTDIKTFVNGTEVVSYNIDGQTVIPFNTLSEQGEIEWNQEARMASLYLDKPDNEKEIETGTVQLAEEKKDRTNRKVTETPVSRRKTTVDPSEGFLEQGNYSPLMIPEHIKIGLFYGSTSTPSIKVKSADGLLAGFYESNQFQKILMLDRVKEISLNKDSHYYVGLKRPFKTLSQANSSLLDISEGIGQELFFASTEEGWNLFLGPFSTRQEAQESMGFIEKKTDNTWTIMYPSDTRVRVEDTKGNNTVMTYQSSKPLYFASASEIFENSMMLIGGKRYRGATTAIRQKNSDLTVINLLPMEQYLYGVIPREMPHSWPEEALKAQAVAARGFAVASYDKYAEFGFNLCDTVHSQVYGGFDVEQIKTNRAVDTTKSQVITYNGHLAIPYYHSSSGGHTESSENIWTNPVPYIRGIEDKYSLNSPHSNWEVELSRGEIETILKRNQKDIGNIKNLYVAEISENDRVLSFIIEGTNGKKELIKQESRNMFGLRSSWFHVEHDSEKDIYFFVGKGYGHGIGMSQYGAKRMAEDGYGYADILKHYYSGIRIQ